MRISFSIINLENDAEVGMQRLAQAIRDKQKALGLT